MKLSKRLHASLPRHDIIRDVKIWTVRWVLLNLKTVVDSLRTGIVESHVLCGQSPMHLAESAAPTGSSRLQSSINFGSRN